MYINCNRGNEGAWPYLLGQEHAGTGVLLQQRAALRIGLGAQQQPRARHAAALACMHVVAKIQQLEKFLAEQSG